MRLAIRSDHGCRDVASHGSCARVDRCRPGNGRDGAAGRRLRVGGATPTPEDPSAAERRIAILKRIPIFSHLTYNELVKVVGLTLMRQATGGDDIIVEGERGDELFVVHPHFRDDDPPSVERVRLQ